MSGRPTIWHLTRMIERVMSWCCSTNLSIYASCRGHRVAVLAHEIILPARPVALMC